MSAERKDPEMRLATHHRLALPAALVLSAIALFDAVTHGLTGHWSVFADDSDLPALEAAGTVAHGLAYLGALWVLHVERPRLHVNRAAAGFGWLLFAAFLPLAAGFLLLGPFQAFGVGEGAFDAFGTVIGISFGLQFLAAAGLGLSLLRRPQAGVGSWLLAALPVGLGVTLLLSVVAPDWAHPAYMETLVIVGVALLGTAKEDSRQAARRTPAATRLAG